VGKQSSAVNLGIQNLEKLIQNLEKLGQNLEKLIKNLEFGGHITNN
jgi:exonuclease VII small subunit